MSAPAAHPHDAGTRRPRGARHLLPLLDPAAFAAGAYLLAGDLNSLSRRDPYPPDLGERLFAAGIDKYGHPLRFDVTDALEAFGWVDVLERRRPGSTWVTARRERRGVRFDSRTDYILATPPLAERLARAEVIDAGGASDHDAVLATFASAAPSAGHPG